VNVVGESKMKNRMHTGLVRDCMHPITMPDTVGVSNDIGYDMGLFITDYVSHELFSYFGMETK
jgi:hypothetical protein